MIGTKAESAGRYHRLKRYSPRPSYPAQLARDFNNVVAAARPSAVGIADSEGASVIRRDRRPIRYTARSADSPAPRAGRTPGAWARERNGQAAGAAALKCMPAADRN